MTLDRMAASVTAAHALLKENTIMKFRLPLRLSLHTPIKACLLLLVLQSTESNAAASDMGQMNGMSDPDSASNEDAGHVNAAHGDHTPAHGGLVLMRGDLHFELVAREAGGIELHLSDAMRAELPALTVSDVTIELEREGIGFEPVPMTVSAAGDYWQGPSQALPIERKTTVHLAFVAFDEALVYALPLPALRQTPMAPASSVANSMDANAD